MPNKISSEEIVEGIRGRATVLAKKQANTINKEVNAGLQNTMSKASWNEAFDMFKIGVATDAGIYAGLNESDFFFPEEMSAIETAAMYLVPNAVFSGVAGSVMRYKLKNVVRDVGVLGAEARNAEGLPLSEVMSRPGERSNLVTIAFEQAKVKQGELAKAGGDPVLTANINSQMTGWSATGLEHVEKMGVDNYYPGITHSYKMADAEKATVVNALKNDPTTVMDAVSIEQFSKKNLVGIPESLVKQQVALEDEIAVKLETFLALKEGQKNQKTLQGGELTKLFNKRDELARSTVLKLDVDGSLSLAGSMKPTFADELTGVVRQSNETNAMDNIARSSFGDIVKVKNSLNGEIAYGARLSQADAKVYATVSEDFKIEYPAFAKGEEPKFADLSFEGKTGLQTLMKKAIDDWSPATAKEMLVTPEMSHVQMDAALELVNKFGGEHPGVKAKLRLDGGWQTWDDVEFASLNKKYTEWVTGVNAIGKQAEQFLKLGKGQQKTLEDLVVELNLPNNGLTGFHPIMGMFNDLMKQDIKSLADVFPNLQVMKKEMEKSVLPRGDLLQEYLPSPTASTRGNQLKTYAENREPVLLVTKDSGVNPLDRQELVNAATAQRMELVQGMQMSSKEGAPLIEAMTTEMLRDSERLRAAKDVSSIFEGSQLRSDRATQAMFGLENQPAHVAVDSITNATDNITKAYISAKFEPHNEMFNKILSQNNKGDLSAFNLAVHQQGIGWRGMPELVPLEENGKLIGFKIALEDHATNKKMIEEAYGLAGEEAKQIEFMPTPSFVKDAPYEPLVISPLAAQSMLAINEISQDVLSHINQLRSLSGLKGITRKPLHMLPKNLADKEKVFLLDSNTGELHSIASGNTAVQAKAAASEEIKNAKNTGMDLFEATEKDLENYNMLKLDDFTRMVDFSTSFKQTGKAKGTSFGQTIEMGPEVLKRMQEGLINQYTTTSRVTSAMFFEPELRMAEMSARTSGLSKSTLDKGRTAWDSWGRRALGKKSGDTKQTIGKFYGAAEDVYDTILQKVWDEKVVALKGGQTVGQASREWEGLNKAVPEYNPFKDSLEFLENTMQIKPPHNMLKHAGKLNALAGATMLRMMELGLAAVNIMTLPTLIPVVAGALKRRPGQSLEQWKSEIGAWGSPVDEATALWNPYRASTTGAHFFFTKEGQEIMKEAGAKGHLWQKTVEQMQLFTSPSKGYAERMITKGVDFTSIAVDKTEEWSRGLSYATFYKLGKDNLKLNKDSAMEFAHQMANKTIGDFRPNNRPQIFQGAAGMPFGLFTTFAWNYMQRVFGYMEKGDFKSFFRQQGLQAAFFGTKSLPGFNQYVENFTDNYDGTENMVDRLQKGLGTEVTDALLFGSVGSLTGVAAYTRTDIRLPGSSYLRNFNIADMAPAAGMIKKTYKGISDSLKRIETN